MFSEEHIVVGIENITHLVVLLDSSAPSFCYYNSALEHNEIISDGTFHEIIAFAKQNDIFINIVYGYNEMSNNIKELIDSVQNVKIIPFSLLNKIPDGIPVIDYNDKFLKSIKQLSGLHISNIILRINNKQLSHLSEAVFTLSPIADRINVVLSQIESIEEKQIYLYKSQLTHIAKFLGEKCISGFPFEINALTDRIVLKSMNNCDAGVSHLTIAPDGNWYICPGFYYNNRESLGNISNGVHVKNPSLFNIEKAPICLLCDCYHCKRCVYLNQQITLEVNTPSREQCLLSHYERQVSRSLLLSLNNSGLLLNVAPISPIDYNDPFDLITDTDISKSNAICDIDSNSTDKENNECNPTITPEAEMAFNDFEVESNLVGRITIKECQEIKLLYERRNALKELMQSFEYDSCESLMHQRIVADYKETNLKYQQWWQAKIELYGWEKDESDDFLIDFNSCKVFEIPTK